MLRNMLYCVMLGHALRVQSWILHHCPARPAYLMSLTLRMLVYECSRHTSRTRNPQYPLAIIYLALFDMAFSGQ
jgi:hypothetical protein